MKRSGWMLLLPGLLLVAACDTQNLQDDFAAAASASPAGFTETNDRGEVISVDEDDWRTAPVYIGKVLVDPAYPNPVSEGFITIQVLVQAENEVRGGLLLRGRGSNGNLIPLADLPQAASTGFHAFHFSAGLLSLRGLNRVFIFDAGGEIVSYGDIMVE